MGLTLDAKAAIGDFQRYDKATQKRFKRTLVTYGMLIKGTQKALLRNRVKEWTGKLASTITSKRSGGYGTVGSGRGAYTQEIGPDNERAAYANYIEYGGGSFGGYHYVRDSLKQHEKGFINAIQKDIERPA